MLWFVFHVLILLWKMTLKWLNRNVTPKWLFNIVFPLHNRIKIRLYFKHLFIFNSNISKIKISSYSTLPFKQNLFKIIQIIFDCSTTDSNVNNFSTDGEVNMLVKRAMDGEVTEAWAAPESPDSDDDLARTRSFVTRCLTSSLPSIRTLSPRLFT